MILTASKHFAETVETNYRTHMRLTIRVLKDRDFGTYRCISKNSLGETEGSIRLYGKQNIIVIHFLNFRHIGKIPHRTCIEITTKAFSYGILYCIKKWRVSEWPFCGGFSFSIFSLHHCIAWFQGIMWRWSIWFPIFLSHPYPLQRNTICTFRMIIIIIRAKPNVWLTSFFLSLPKWIS